MENYIPISEEKENQNNFDNSKDEDNNDIHHSGFNNFIFKSNIMKKKTNGIILYKNNEEGKLISNKNVFPDYEKEKDFSIIGRRIELCKIMDLINNNSEHIIIIIYGPKKKKFRRIIMLSFI